MLEEGKVYMDNKPAYANEISTEYTHCTTNQQHSTHPSDRSIIRTYS